MNGVVLYGFNKVGEKTWTNVVPMLTGKPVPGELPTENIIKVSGSNYEKITSQ